MVNKSDAVAIPEEALKYLREIAENGRLMVQRATVQSAEQLSSAANAVALGMGLKGTLSIDIDQGTMRVEPEPVAAEAAVESEPFQG